MSNDQVIQYVGLSDVRTLTIEDLKLLGVKEPKTALVWSWQNGWKIPVKDLPEEVLNYCEHKDQELVIRPA